MQDNGNVIVYVDDNGKPQVDVRFQDETVWLTQARLVELYQSSKANVSERIKNIFDDGELDRAATVGMTSFRGKRPTPAEAVVAKNYLSQEESKTPNNLVSAYFDIAEINAMEEKPMRMADHLRELDAILSSTGRKLLDNAGKIGTKQAKEKALAEYRKYKAKNLSGVEEDYLENIKKTAKKLKGKIK